MTLTCMSHRLEIIFLLLINWFTLYSSGGNPRTWWSKVSIRYPKYKETTEIIHDIVRKYPDIASYYSVGKTVGGRDMWVIHLTENVRRPRKILKPMVKQSANIHGDEALGRSLLLMLAVDILQRYSNGDGRVVNLLKTTDIHLMPSINPDGFEEAVQTCNPDPLVTGRRNKNKVDLNRNFPDQFTIQNESDPQFYRNRESETLNIMRYIKSYPFVLSSNFHGGAIVASYGYFSVSHSVKNQNEYNNSGVPSLAPDDKVFKYLAQKYARNHKTMSKLFSQRAYNPEGCDKNLVFPNGVTNGAEWSNVEGAMQDFNYFHSNCFEISVELACCKYPPESSLIVEWNNNKESLYIFMESVHMGVKGFIKSTQGSPIKNSYVIVKHINKAIKATKAGEFWRLLVPGKYEIGAVAENFQPSPMKVIEVRENITSHLDFVLHPVEMNVYEV